MRKRADIRHFWVIVSVLAVAGCMGGSTLESWKGHQVNDLVFAWGPPDKQDRLPDGRQVLSYGHSHMIGATSYDCDAMFRVDAAGIVQSAEADGNIGGCNRLLLSKPSAR